MSQVEELHTEGDGSPQMISLRSDVSTSNADDGEAGPSIRRKRRKKKDPRPESIIIYRSDLERAPGEDQGGEEVTERSIEEGAKFLCTPTGEGETLITFTNKSSTDIYVILEMNSLRNNKKLSVIPSFAFRRRWLEPSAGQPLRDSDGHHHPREEERSDGGHSPHHDGEGAQGSGQVQGASGRRVRGGRGLQACLQLRRVPGAARCPVERLLRPRGLPPLLHHLLLLRHPHLVQRLPGVQRRADVLAQDHHLPLPHHLLPHAHHAHGAVPGPVLSCGAGVLGLQRLVAGREGPGERILRLGLWQDGVGGLLPL